MKKLVFLSCILLLFLGCVENQENVSMNKESNSLVANTLENDANKGVDVMKVEKGDKVKVEYVGKLANGEIFDKSEGRGPLEFEVGAGQMIKGFDEAVVGMKLNEEKTVTIAPEDAYGLEGSGQKIEVPREQINADGNLTVGSMLFSQANGMQFRVVGISQDNVILQVVHPLEGKTLIFWIKVVGIEK